MSNEEFLEYVRQTKSPNTYRAYRFGIQAFSDWFEKTPNEILEMRKEDWISGDQFQKKRFVREIEKFHKSLIDEGKSINTARLRCVGIIQLFRYYEMPVSVPTGSDISKSVISTKDFVPTPSQIRDMFKVADNIRDRLIVSMGKDLGWRIGDFIKQRRDQLPDLELDPPIAYDLITEKEDVLAKSFLSVETVELIKEHLATIPKDSTYLFASNKDKHIDDDTINRILRQLAEKAEIKVPQNKRLRFHSFRKRFLSTCADLSVDVNIAKILCGKDVESSMLTYLSEIEHRKAFLKVHDVLNITGTTMRKTTKPTTELEKELDDLKRLVHGLIALGLRDKIEEARELAHLETWPFETEDFIEAIKRIGDKEIEKQKARAKEQAPEYRRLIASVNNENNK